MICDAGFRVAAMRIKLAAILAAPLAIGVSDLLTSPGKTERLLRRRFIAATVDGTWDTPVLTEHPHETAAIAALVVWRALAGSADHRPGLVNQVFTGKDGTETHLRARRDPVPVAASARSRVRG